MKVFSRVLGTIALFFVAFFLIGVFVPRVSYTIELDIEQPQHVVFQGLTDSELLPQWVEGLETSELIDGETGVPGSVYSLVVKDGRRNVEFKEEVLRFEPDSVLSYSLVSQALSGVVVIRAKSIKTGTSLKIETELIGQVWFVRSLLPLYSQSLKERNSKDYQRLRSLLVE